MMSLLIIFLLLFFLLKFFRLIYYLLSLEFLFITLIFFFFMLNKINEMVILFMLGVFSSVVCVSIFLKFVIYFGCDFVKF